VWDATTGTPLGTVPIGSDAYALGFSPDGRLLVAGPDPTGALLLLDATTLTRTGELTGGAGEVFAFAFDGAGRLVSVGSDGVGRVYDLATRREVLTLSGHNGPVGAVAVSPDGETIATGGADGTAKLWDADTGQEILTLTGHTKAVYSVAFSPDGGLLATASHDGTVALHPSGIDELTQVARARVTRSLTTGECMLYLHTSTCPTR
jgi:WD40 repeat protein